MSNPQTFYTVGGLDLSGIFQPLALGQAYPYTTGYKIPDGRDFNQIFANNTGSTIGYNTGYDVSGTDLRLIFAPYDPILTISITNLNQYINTSDFTESGYTVYTFETTNPADISTTEYTTGTCNVSFSINSSIYFLAIGGGGAGGSSLFGSAGGGGGGGGYLSGSVAVVANTNYTLQVGSGGVITNPIFLSGENSFFNVYQGIGGQQGGSGPSSQSGGSGGPGGGNGGNGGSSPTNGDNGTPTFITLYGETISIGGGGGGGKDNTGGSGGGGGNNGVGGLAYNGTTLTKNGNGYGAGGGGASDGGSGTSGGGYGASGLVILYWLN